MSPQRPFRAARTSGRGAVLVELLWRANDRTSLAWLGLALALVLAGSATAMAGPWLLKTFIDQLAAAPRAGPHGAIGLGLSYVALLSLQRLAEQLQAFTYARGEQRLVSRLGERAYAHLLKLPLPVILARRSGALAQALADGTLGARLLLTHAVMTVGPALAQLVMAAAVLASVVGARASSLVVATLLAYAAAFAWSARRQASPALGVSAAQTQAAGIALDGLMNVEALKVFAAEGRYAQRHTAALGARERAWRRLMSRRLEGGLAVSVLFALVLGSVAVGGAYEVSLGRIGVGALVLLNALVLQIVRPLEMVGYAMRDLGPGLAYLDALVDLLHLPPEEDDVSPALVCADGPASLAFRDVDFPFGDRGPGLSGLTFRVEPGGFVGVVGPSGSGKSTLLKLVLRLYEPQRGEILLDGRPIAQTSRSLVRGQVALVSQDTILLHDTIGANIALAATDPDDEAIAQAARAARLGDLIERLPLGLQTTVGERGLHLSGGEKQRVSIARAALRRARLVLFDEATASLDPATEEAVWQAIRELRAGATILAVTHRLATVVGADEILVMEAGKIVERGRHADLLARGGLYSRLWDAQARSA